MTSVIVMSIEQRPLSFPCARVRSLRNECRRAQASRSERGTSRPAATPKQCARSKCPKRVVLSTRCGRDVPRSDRELYSLSRLKFGSILAALACFVSSSHAEFILSNEAKPACVIVQQTGATAAEQHPIRELKLHLDLITGGNFQVITNAPPPGGHAIIVGPRAVAAKLFPDLSLSNFGPEEYVARVASGTLLFAGGRPRGTIYAVDRFRQKVSAAP